MIELFDIVLVLTKSLSAVREFQSLHSTVDAVGTHDCPEKQLLVVILEIHSHNVEQKDGK